MTKARLFLILVIILLLINAGLVTLFFIKPPVKHQGGPPPMGGNGKIENIVIERLSLDEKQIAAYEHLIEVHRMNIREKQEGIHQIKSELYQTFANPEASDRDALIEKLGQLQMDIERIHFHHFKDLRTVCRPDQLADFDAFSEELASIFQRHQPQRPRP